MKLSIAGEVYSGGVVKFDTNTPIDCGSGYTGDELASNMIVTRKPQYVQDLLSPGYYYTDTNTLAKMGYEKYLNYFIGDGSSNPKRTLPVLISVPDNYVLVDDTTSQQFIQKLFILAYYNESSPDNKLNKSFNSLIFTNLGVDAASTTTLPFLPSQLGYLKFYDSNNTPISFTTTMTPEEAINAAADIQLCVFKSPVADKEYPLKFYTRSDGVICDMYIGGYHMQLLTCYTATNDFTHSTGIYISACNDSDFNNKFWFSLNRLEFVNTAVPIDTFDDRNQYGYAFGSRTITDSTAAWNTGDKDRVIGKNLADTYIRYYKSFDNTSLQVGNGLALDFDPNIFNTIGVDYPSNYSTVGILSPKINLDYVGVDGFIKGKYYLLKIATQGLTNLLYLPLGTYILDPTSTYNYNNTTLSGRYRSLTVYSPNGNTLVQTITAAETDTSHIGYPTLFRINNNTNTSGNFDVNWSSWETRGWS